MKTKVLIFGGTTEGRLVAKALAENGVDRTLHTATEYGKELAAIQSGCDGGVESLSCGRLTADEMRGLITKNSFTHVVDATHPYAEIATENIKAACYGTCVIYLRLRRETDGETHGENVFYVENAEEAAEILNKPDNSDDCVLLAVGSKELPRFINVTNYQKRLFPRILPMKESLNMALELGFGSSNIICMQGPFDAQMNVATLRAVGARWLVTKSSGNIGGFREKLSAAKTVGASVIVIKEPSEKTEKSFSVSEILEIFGVSSEQPSRQFTFFPLFVDMSGKKVVVIGGGKIAERRIVKLLASGANITVVSPGITEMLAALAESGKIKHKNREYTIGDAENAFLTIAATNIRAVNDAVAREVNARNGLVIVSDKRKDCGCYFPAIVENADFIAGIVSKGCEHKAVKNIAENIRRSLNYD